MKRMGCVAVIASTLLVIASLTRAQEIGCVEYGPDQSGMVRTILDRTGCTFLHISEDLALVNSLLVDLQDPENPVPLPTENWRLGHVYAATSDSAGYWFLTRVDGYHNGETVVKYVERENIGHADSEDLLRLNGTPYAFAFGDDTAFIASSIYNPDSRESSSVFYMVDLRTPGQPRRSLEKYGAPEQAPLSSMYWSNHLLWSTHGTRLQGRPTRYAEPDQSSYFIESGATMSKVAADANKVFVHHANGVIQAFAIAVPSTLEPRGSIRVPGSVTGMWLYDELLVLALHGGGFLVLDVSDVDQLRVRDFWPRYAAPRQAVLSGDHLYFVDADSGVEQILVDTRSREPVPLYSLHSTAWSLLEPIAPLHPLEHWQAMAIGVERRIHAERITGFGTRHSLGSIQLASQVRALESRGSTLYAAVSGHGVIAVEVTENGSLIERGRAAYGPTLTELRAHQAALYALDPRLGVLIVDLAVPDAPRLHSALDLQHPELRTLTLYGSRLLVLADDELFVLELVDPLDPRPLRAYPVAPGHRHLAVTTRGDLALARVSDPTVSLHRFDGDGAPELVRNLALDSEVTALHAVDDVLYIGTKSSGVQAFEVSRAEFATDLGHLGVPGSTTNIRTVGDLLVTLSQSASSVKFTPRACTDVRVSSLLRLFDVLTHSRGLLIRAEVENAVADGALRVEVRTGSGLSTTHPMLATSRPPIHEAIVPRPTESCTLELQLHEGTQWRMLAERTLEPALVESHFHLVCVQPADRSESATVRFRSPEPIVDVSVFDLRGRRVVRLAAAMSPGEGTLTWDRRGLARGTYFLRMQTEGRSISEKIQVGGN